MTTPANPPKIVVFTDNDENFPTAKGITIDGIEYWVPSGSTVTTEIGNEAPLTVTLTLFASDVEFVPRPVEEVSDGSKSSDDSSRDDHAARALNL